MSTATVRQAGTDVSARPPGRSEGRSCSPKTEYVAISIDSETCDGGFEAVFGALDRARRDGEIAGFDFGKPDELLARAPGNDVARADCGGARLDIDWTLGRAPKVKP